MVILLSYIFVYKKNPPFKAKQCNLVDVFVMCLMARGVDLIAIVRELRKDKQTRGDQKNWHQVNWAF